jgi:hypothetical protein|tara:strand:+ start:685 stop:954 length:270 start_codon:yes stop_codon:yes gene_type:complete
MAESWEDVTWDQSNPKKEWVVEYTVSVNGKKNHHLSILYGEDMSEIQKSLLNELRNTYVQDEKIEVTVHRMEEVQDTSESVSFEGCFSP